MPRTTAKAKFSKPHYANMLHTTVFGSEVICENLNLLYEEAPEAYRTLITSSRTLKTLVLVGLLRCSSRWSPTSVDRVDAVPVVERPVCRVSM
jgi:hypothetical protein